MQDQHYQGLIAEWYDDWLKERTDDRDYYVEFFRGFEGRVLELACGTGRLLVPLATTGVAIDGLDSSQDVLNVLGRKITQLGLQGIELYHQPMENFTLPGKYGAIFIASGSFQLLTLPTSARASLKCIRQHLSENGFFLLDLFVPWGNIIEQGSETYRVTREVVRANGWRSIVLERFKIDIRKQLKQGTYRYEFYDQKQLAACITDDLSIRWYWKDEFINFVHSVGFSKIEVLSDSPLYDEGYSFVFKAYK